MEYKRFGDKLVMRLDPDDEICESIMTASKAEGIRLASVSGMGAVGQMTVGVYDLSKKEYFKNTFTGALEIVSLTGNVSEMNGETYLHLHMSAGDDRGHVFGGHLNSSVISGTGEIILDIIDGRVDRERSDETGLNVFKF